MLDDLASAEMNNAAVTTEPMIKDGTPLGKPKDWGFHNDPELVLRQTLFYERSGFREFKDIHEIARIQAEQWEDAQEMLHLMAYFRWLHKPMDE